MQTHVVIMVYSIDQCAHTHMKDTNQAGADYRSWLGFNIQYEVQTQHNTHNGMSTMPTRTSPNK